MSFLSDFWRIARADRTGLAGAVVVAFYVLMAVFGPFVAHVSTVQDPGKAYLSPSWHHLLGTDSFGQDVMAQVIVGTRPIMEVGVLAASITVFVGVVVGLVSGYLAGTADTVLMRVTDVVLTVPGLPLILVISSVVRTSSPVVLALILSVTAWAGLARAVRSQALSLRTSDFIEAARLQGASLANIVGRQLLPNVGPYVAINFLLAITGAMYAEVGLFLLGIAPVSGTNWGVMINTAMNQGALYTSKSMLYLFSPMAAIVILQVAFVYLTRVLDSLFNPRLRVQ